jgi:hypothetical protein
MTALLAVLLLAALAAPPAVKRKPIVSAAVAAALDRKGNDIEIIVVGDAEDGQSAGSNVLELGRVSYQPPSHGGRRGGPPVSIVRRTVTVRIGAGRTGFAPLRAALSGSDGRCRIRVDGRTLTTVPQVIDPLAPLGQPVAHVVEIEIADTAAEGPVSASIAWTSDPQ